MFLTSMVREAEAAGYHLLPKVDLMADGGVSADEFILRWSKPSPFSASSDTVFSQGK